MISLYRSAVMQRRSGGAWVVVLFAAAAAATLFPLWREPGWPFSHDGPLFAFRTYIYARHFSWLDLIPIWSSTDAYGFGSPMPAMYHKTFALLSGAVALVTSVKTAMAATIALLLVFGALGVHALMLALGSSRLAAAVAGVALVTANYTVTNWLVRGAVAEFTAAMLVPWLLRLFVRTIDLGRMPAALGLTLALMWLSHSVLAYFAALMLAATYVLLAALRLAPWSALRPQTAWRPVAAFVLPIVPFLVPMAVLGRLYDMRRILTPPMQPAYQFVAPSRYFWDENWRFGRTVSGFTVQIDLAMIALLVVSVAALCVRNGGGEGVPRRLLVRRVLPFALIVVIGLALQWRIAAPFYEWMPGASFLQFPWRLLALMTPALIVVAVLLADGALPGDARLFALGAGAAWMVAACGAFVPIQDPRFSFEPVRSVTFSGFREYEPRAASATVHVTLAALSARWVEAGCGYERVDEEVFEAPSVEFRTSCGRSTALPLPLYSSPLHLATIVSADYERRQGCLALPAFPGVCGAVIPAGQGRVSVRIPTLAAIPGWLLDQLGGSSR
jgi:hypothetical protein